MKKVKKLIVTQKTTVTAKLELHEQQQYQEI